jgi:hypothetical protein
MVNSTELEGSVLTRCDVCLAIMDIRDLSYDEVCQVWFCHYCLIVEPWVCQWRPLPKP